LEIATADDASEPIYVRQYSGVFSNISRTLTLLDGSGNTVVPGRLGVNRSPSSPYHLDVSGQGRFSNSVLIQNNLTTTGQIYINNGSPTIYLRDSNHRSSMIHCNSNRFYILRGSGNNSTSWVSTNNHWPLEINLENNDAEFGGALTVNGNILSTGTVTAISDIKLKDNIVTIENALEKVMNLRGVKYNRKDLDNVTEIGVIAQEVQKVLPEVVFEDDGIKSVAYGNIIAVLIEAIKELKLKLDNK